MRLFSTTQMDPRNGAETTEVASLSFMSLHTWSASSMVSLVSLHRLHGNRWKAIGLTMGISSSAALSKYKILRRKQRGKVDELEPSTVM